MSLLGFVIKGQARQFIKVIMIAFLLSQSGRTSRFAANAWAPTSLPVMVGRTIRNHRGVSYCQASSRNELILPSHEDTPIQTVMAPMVAASDFSFRCLVEKHGADLTFTQMLHARNLVEDAVFRRNHLDFCSSTRQDFTKSQLDCIEGMPTIQQQEEEEHVPGPLIVQLAGHDSDLMMQAFDVLMEEQCEFDGIDVNLGCPQGIARKGNYGAFLHEYNEDLVCDILQKLRRHVPPHLLVSCKIRLPRSLREEDVKNRIQRVTEAGVNFVTVHGRTLEENKTKTRAVHMDMIRLAVETAGNIPIIANGGVETHLDVNKLRETTNAAAIMSSEALLETPNIFTVDSTKLSPHELFCQQVDMAREYMSQCTATPPLPGVLGGYGSFAIVKGHLFKILHRYLHQHTDIRDQLTRCTRLVDAVEVLDELTNRYQTAEDCSSCPSSKMDASWYRRHWAANRQVHQRSRYAEQQGNVQSVEERKEEMKQRIAKLRQERLSKHKAEERLAV